MLSVVMLSIDMLTVMASTNVLRKIGPSEKRSCLYNCNSMREMREIVTAQHPLMSSINTLSENVQNS